MSRRVCYKEMAQVIWGLSSQKSVGQACSLETGVGTPVLRQNFSLGNLRFCSEGLPTD